MMFSTDPDGSTESRTTSPLEQQAKAVKFVYLHSHDSINVNLTEAEHIHVNYVPMNK